MERLIEKVIEDETTKKKSVKTKKVAKSKKTGETIAFKALYSVNLGSNPDGSPKESYRYGKLYSFHTVNDKEKINRLKKLKII